MADEFSLTGGLVTVTSPKSMHSFLGPLFVMVLGLACRGKSDTGDSSSCSYRLFNQSVTGTAHIVAGESYQGNESLVFDQIDPDEIPRYCVIARELVAGRADVAGGCSGCDFAFAFERELGQPTSDSVACSSSMIEESNREMAYAFDSDYSGSGGKPQPTMLVKYDLDWEWEPAAVYGTDAHAALSRSGFFYYTNRPRSDGA